MAHEAGRQVALTLSDVFCVDRHQQEFLRLIRDGVVDILFANESELHALYQTADFDRRSPPCAMKTFWRR